MAQIPLTAIIQVRGGLIRSCFLKDFLKLTLSPDIVPMWKGCVPDPRTALMDHCEPSYVKKKECYPCAHPAEAASEQSAGEVGWPSHGRKLITSVHSPNEGPGARNVCPNKSSLDFSPSSEPTSLTSNNSFMGKCIHLWDTLTRDPYFTWHVGEPWELQMLNECKMVFWFWTILLWHSIS